MRTTTHEWGTRVELAAPDVRNALDPAAVAALLAVFTDDGPGALVLSARGPVFCAGGDLRVLARAAAGGDLVALLTRNASAFADLVEAVVASRRPVVAAIDGPAVGGGASLALACDVRIASDRARLVLGWGRWGLPPDGGAGALLTAAVGAAPARELLAESAEIGVGSPYAAQVFTRVVAADVLEQEAVAAAANLSEAPGARAAKRAAAAPVLASLRAERAAELAAVVRAAGDPSVAERLAMLYKM